MSTSGNLILSGVWFAVAALTFSAWAILPAVVCLGVAAVTEAFRLDRE
jgi:hypothetical protein